MIFVSQVLISTAGLLFDAAGTVVRLRDTKEVYSEMRTVGNTPVHTNTKQRASLGATENKNPRLWQCMHLSERNLPRVHQKHP